MVMIEESETVLLSPSKIHRHVLDISDLKKNVIPKKIFIWVVPSPCDKGILDNDNRTTH